MSRTWRTIASASSALSTARWTAIIPASRPMLLETIKLALTTIIRNALRSVLTLLGVTIGVDNRYFEVRKWDLAAGRQFHDAELVSGAASCVIGKAAADSLFGTADPLGQNIRLKSVICKVVGVLAEKGTGSFGSNQDDVI